MDVPPTRFCGTFQALGQPSHGSSGPCSASPTWLGAGRERGPARLRASVGNEDLSFTSSIRSRDGTEGRSGDGNRESFLTRLFQLVEEAHPAKLSPPPFLDGEVED